MPRIDIMRASTWTMCLCTLMLIWLYPTMSVAQDGVLVETSAAQDFLLMAVKIVFTILSVLTTWLVGKAIVFFERKTTIDIPASTEDLMYKWADRGIGLATEKSHQAVKKHGKKLKGPEKLEIALKFVSDMVKKYKLEAMAEEKLTEYVESKLGLNRKDALVMLSEATVENVEG